MTVARATQVSLVFCILFTGAILAAILLTKDDSRSSVQSFTIVITAGSASATSLAFGLKAKVNRNEVSRSLSYLSLGLLLWFVAEIVWAYYVNVMQVEVPFPSIADAFYLAAYVPVGISLYILGKSAAVVRQENRLVITTVAVTITAFITNVFLLQIADSAIGFTQLSSDKAILLMISLAYPLLDGALFVPAIIVLYSFRKNREHLTWLLVAASMLVMAAADTGFGYTALVEIEALASETIWDILYNISYILLATGMVNGLVTKYNESRIIQPA